MHIEKSHQEKTKNFFLLKKLAESSPGNLLGTTVTDGNIDKALRRFKKTVKDSGIVLEMFNRREFTKPSIIKRKQKKEARYRQRRHDEESY
jgi:small subunit ribosomal protein S21